MTPAEQQALFEKTRAQIQRNVAEISELARTCPHPATFFKEFLARAVSSLAAHGGAIWAPVDRDFQVVSEINFASCAYHENERQRNDIHRALADVVKNNRPLIVAAVHPDVDPIIQPAGEDEILNTTKHPFFYIPILLNDRTASVLQIWLAQAGDPKTYGDLVTFLKSICQHATTFLKNRQGETAIVKNQEFDAMLRCLGDLVGELDEKKIGAAAVNHLFDLLRVSRCSLFRKHHGKWKLEFVSNQETIDHKSELVQHLVKIASDLPVSKEPQVLSVENPDWKDRLEPMGDRAIAYVHFSPDPLDPDSGLLLMERNEPVAFAASTLQQAHWAANQVGKALQASATHQEIPFRSLLHPVLWVKRQWKQKQYVRLSTWIGAPAVAILFWLVIPWRLSITGDCVILPQHQVTLTAEANGKIQKVYVREGDFVQAGTLVAKLEDRDIVTQIAVAEQEMLRWQSEALRNQSLGDDAQRKLAEINMEREHQSLERLKYLESRTEIRTPIDGVILTKNMQNREGEAFEVGKPVCEVADRDTYEVVVDIKQQDLGVLLEDLKKLHKLPVHFILHSYSQTPLDTVITGPEAIGEVAQVKAKGSFFQVTAAFPLSNELRAHLKPGYTGKAVIYLGRRSLAGVMLRRFLDYWRVETLWLFS